MSLWKVVESIATPKVSPGLGEDRLVVVQEGRDVTTAAVIDGCTDKSGRDYDGMSGGARAADTIAAVLENTPDNVTPAEAVNKITESLASWRRAWNIDITDPVAPCAVAAVFMPRQQLVWRVGDVHVAYLTESGWHQHPANKTIDHIVSSARAALLECHLQHGATVDELQAADPGRDMMLPLLRLQNVLANSHHHLGFGILDGRNVPQQYLEILPLPHDASQVVLASDGYLQASPTGADAEQHLANSLAKDPLRIGPHASTKSLTPGNTSFDDRTYLRLQRA